MTGELLLPATVAGAAMALTYFLCVRPMRAGGHCATPRSADADIQRLDKELADLRASVETALAERQARGVPGTD